MRHYIRTLGGPLALTAALAFTACSSDKSKDASLAADSTLNKDLQLAGKDTASQPALKDVATPPPAAAPAPSVAPTRRREPEHRTEAERRREAEHAAPAPVPDTRTTPSGNIETHNRPGQGSGGGAVGTVASGTVLNLRSNARVCTNTYTVGQTFNATVANSVSGSNGASIPAGATVSLEVATLKRSENSNDKIVMEFNVRSVSFNGHTYQVSASVANADITRVRNEPKSKDVEKVAGGAILGAIAGRILGGSTKGTVIGGAAGAAAGAGVAAGTANYEGCLTDGAGIAVTLNSPLQIKVSA